MPTTNNPKENPALNNSIEFNNSVAMIPLNGSPIQAMRSFNIRFENTQTKSIEPYFAWGNEHTNFIETDDYRLTKAADGKHLQLELKNKALEGKFTYLVNGQMQTISIPKSITNKKKEVKKATKEKTDVYQPQRQVLLKTDDYTEYPFLQHEVMQVRVPAMSDPNHPLYNKNYSTYTIDFSNPKTTKQNIPGVATVERNQKNGTYKFTDIAMNSSLFIGNSWQNLQPILTTNANVSPQLTVILQNEASIKKMKKELEIDKKKLAKVKELNNKFKEEFTQEHQEALSEIEEQLNRIKLLESFAKKGNTLTTEKNLELQRYRAELLANKKELNQLNN